MFLAGPAEEAFQLRDSHPGALIAGEQGGQKIAGFDFGNSPEEIEKQSLSGRTLILRSSSGTQGVVQARKADKIVAASLVVASSTIAWVRKQRPRLVTILAMGSPNGPDKEEDLACQEYLARHLRGEIRTAEDEQRLCERVRREVQDSPAGRQALDPSIPWKTAGDLERVLRINCFAFAMPVSRRDGLHKLVGERIT